MSRPNLGPKLVLVRKVGFTRSIYFIRWTEGGRSRERSTGQSDPRAAQAAFEDWQAERRRTRRAGPGDPDQVLIRHILEDYAREHGTKVASPDAIAFGVEPMLAFFEGDTISELTPRRVEEYWAWR